MPSVANWSGFQHSAYLGAEGSSTARGNIVIRAPDGFMQRNGKVANRNFSAHTNAASWVIGLAFGVLPHAGGVAPTVTDSMSLDNTSDFLLGNISGPGTFERNMIFRSSTGAGGIGAVLWGNADGVGGTNVGVHGMIVRDNWLSDVFAHQHAASNTPPHYSGNTFETAISMLVSEPTPIPSESVPFVIGGAVGRDGLIFHDDGVPNLKRATYIDVAQNYTTGGARVPIETYQYNYMARAAGMQLRNVSMFTNGVELRPRWLFDCDPMCTRFSRYVAHRRLSLHSVIAIPVACEAFIELIAQEARPAFAFLVNEDSTQKIDGTAVLTVDPSALTYALIDAV